MVAGARVDSKKRKKKGRVDVSCEAADAGVEPPFQLVALPSSPTLSYPLLLSPTLTYPLLPSPTLSYPLPTLSYPLLPSPTLSYSPILRHLPAEEAAVALLSEAEAEKLGRVTCGGDRDTEMLVQGALDTYLAMQEKKTHVASQRLRRVQKGASSLASVCASMLALYCQ